MLTKALNTEMFRWLQVLFAGCAPESRPVHSAIFPGASIICLILSKRTGVVRCFLDEVSFLPLGGAATPL